MVPRPSALDDDSPFVSFAEFNALADAGNQEPPPPAVGSPIPPDGTPPPPPPPTAGDNEQQGDPPGNASPPHHVSPTISKIGSGIRSYKIIDPFRGDKGHDVVEFLAKFEETYGLLNWPESTKYNVLRVNIEGAPFQIVDNNVRVAKDDPTAYSKAKQVLLSRYAPSIFSTWQSAVSRTLCEGESSGDYMSELQKLFRQCIPTTFSVTEAERSNIVDFFVCLQFWRGLPSSTPGLMGLRQQWQTELSNTTSDMIEHALNSCKAVTADGFTAVTYPSHNRGYSSKGGTHSKGRASGKGKGKGAVSRDIYKPARPYGKGTVRCYNCNGRGHVAADCPSQPVRQKDSTSQVSPIVIQGDLSTGTHRYISICFRCNGQSDKSFDGMIDTGSSISLVCRSVLVDLGIDPGGGTSSISSIHSLAGSFPAAKLISTVLSVAGVQVHPYVTDKASLLFIDGQPIRALLGLDWLRATGGISFTYGQRGWNSHLRCNPKYTYTITDIEGSVSGKSLPQSAPLVLHEKDMILVRHVVTDEARKNNPRQLYQWEVSWLWRNGVVPRAPIRHVPHYPQTLEKLSQHETKLFHDSIQTMIDNHYFEPVEPREVKATVTTMPVVSLGRSTPVRVVIDYKFLNELIESCPNDRGGPVSCPSELRKWRSLDPREYCAIDIKHAYMQIHIAQDLKYWQCAVFPHLAPGPTTYAMTRAGFGLAVSGKALEVCTDNSISRVTSQLHYPVRKYVDDMAVHKRDVELVQRTLAEDGFVIKEPQPLLGSKVIGIHITSDGTWTRKVPLDLLAVPYTRTELASLAGKLATYYPIAGWLRLCSAMLTRVASTIQTANSFEYNFPLPQSLQDLWKAVCRHIAQTGDPCRGTWLFDIQADWRLFTDASSVGLAAVLYMGDVKVEDRAWLRKKGCKRRININETEAVVRGLDIITDYMKAYQVKSKVVHLYTDNVSVQSWLTRKEGRHWRKISGMSKGAIEGRLQIVDDVCDSFGITLRVHHCSSSQNEVDEASRLPEGLRDLFLKQLQAYELNDVPENQSNFACISAVERATEERNDDLAQFLLEYEIHNHKLVVPRDQAQALLALAHDHEGRAAMFNNLREYIDMPGLAAECNKYTCQDCAAAKAFPGDNQPLIPLVSIKPAPKPFDRLHTDICGPYRRIESGTSRFYLITAIDSCTNYVAIRPSLHQPTADDVQNLLQSLVDTFQRRPLLVQSDRGSQYTAKSIENMFEKWNTVHILTAVHSSHSNGKIERWHRFLNEYLRAHVEPNLTYGEFCRQTRRACVTYNRTPRKGPGSSPHEQVFRFKPSLRPEVPLPCHESYEYLREVLRDPPVDSLKPGLPVLVRVSGIVPKLQRRWMPAIVIKREGTNRLCVKRDDGSEALVHTIDVKLL